MYKRKVILPGFQHFFAVLQQNVLTNSEEFWNVLHIQVYLISTYLNISVPPVFCYFTTKMPDFVEVFFFFPTSNSIYSEYAILGILEAHINIKPG